MQPLPSIDTVVGGRYRIVRKLGSGGMGGVYEARQIDLDRRVAIKVLRAELATDPDAIARFRREAQAAAALGHPHIVQLVDFLEVPDEPPAIVMELLEGSSLASVLAEQAPLGVDRAVSIAVQILTALEAAHAAGVIHRDVKPGNVFLVQGRGVTDFVKLVDFGVAKLIDGHAATLTATGAMVGTPAYMAPEQMHGGAVDARSDLYAVGVILYEALTGQRAFGSGSPTATIVAALHSMPQPVSSLRPGVPVGVSAIVERAMQKSPDRRFASAAQMKEALRPFASATTAGQGGGVADDMRAATPPPPTRMSLPTDNATTRRPIEAGAQPRRGGGQAAWILGTVGAIGGLGLVVVLVIGAGVGLFVTRRASSTREGGPTSAVSVPAVFPSTAPRSDDAGSALDAEPSVDAGDGRDAPAGLAAVPRTPLEKALHIRPRQRIGVRGFLTHLGDEPMPLDADGVERSVAPLGRVIARCIERDPDQITRSSTSCWRVEARDDGLVVRFSSTLQPPAAIIHQCAGTALMRMRLPQGTPRAHVCFEVSLH